MENSVLRVIADRRSIRAYKDTAVTAEQIEVLKNAALQSPSANNLQPLHFSFIMNRQLLAKANDVFEAFMAQTGKTSYPKSLGAKNLFYDAPLVVVICADAKAKRRALDAGIAVQTLALAAQSIGLSSVIIAMLDAVFDLPGGSELKVQMGFPEGYEFAVAIAIGIGDTSKEPHDMRPQNITVIE